MVRVPSADPGPPASTPRGAGTRTGGDSRPAAHRGCRPRHDAARAHAGAAVAVAGAAVAVAGAAVAVAGGAVPVAGTAVSVAGTAVPVAGGAVPVAGPAALAAGRAAGGRPGAAGTDPGRLPARAVLHRQPEVPVRLPRRRPGRLQRAAEAVAAGREPEPGGRAAACAGAGDGGGAVCGAPAPRRATLAGRPAPGRRARHHRPVHPPAADTIGPDGGAEELTRPERARQAAPYRSRSGPGCAPAVSNPVIEAITTAASGVMMTAGS